MSRGERIHVIALGGTIAMTGSRDAGVRPTLSAADLLGSVDDAPDVEVTAETLRTVPGSYLTIDDILAVVIRAHQEFERGAGGVVVVQGTDTLEETAFVADLVHVGPHPLVFTGAMRHPAALGADGPANLRDAIIAASQLRDVGALVCMNTELHAARLVAKEHAFSPSAFGSPSSGPVGWVVENQAMVVTSVPPVSRFDVAELAQGVSPCIPLYRVSLGDDGLTLTAVADSDPAGLVLEGFGVGHVGPEVARIAAELAARIPVVLVSRTGAGASLRSTYGFEGSERDLLERGLLSGGALSGVKARLLLQLSLMAGEGRPELTDRLRAWSAPTRRSD